MPLSVKELVAQVSAEHGIRLDPGDPAMAVVTLNRLVFEQAVAEVVGRVQSAGQEFEEAAERAQIRAGAVLAQEVRDTATVVRRELERGVEAARAGGGGPALGSGRTSAWVAIGLASGIMLFAFGIWVGTLVR